MGDVEALKKQEQRKRINSGYMWALICAVFWGLWYIPGEIIWNINPFNEILSEVSHMMSGSGSMVVVAAEVSALNALFALLSLIIWNGCLLRLNELGRTIKNFNLYSKWLLAGSVFGGTCCNFWLIYGNDIYWKCFCSSSKSSISCCRLCSSVFMVR